jgi:hypothetical protein
MASSVATAVAESDAVEREVECPICFEIPRDGVMLQCCNGHNVCPTCKNQLDANNRKCPQGQCSYLNPPARSRTVADLVACFPFKFPCKFATARDHNHSSCEVVGTNDMLQRHEAICEHRSVECPTSTCKKSVSAKRLIEHFEREHNVEVFDDVRDTMILRFLWKREYIWRCGGWCSEPVGVEGGGWAFPCAHFSLGQVYIWLQMAAHRGVTDKLKCKISLSQAVFAMRATAPVYPIDWNRERIIQDEGCVRLNGWAVRRILTEDITEEQRKKGYSSRFKVKFTIVARNA